LRCGPAYDVIQRSPAADKNSLTPPFRDGKQEKDEAFGGGVMRGGDSRQSDTDTAKRDYEIENCERLPARGISSVPDKRIFFLLRYNAVERYRDRIENAYKLRFNELAVLILH
jgi:hypothetical protein